MLNFNPNEPFPLLPENTFSYPEQKLHSAEVDHWLGLRIEETELSIRSSPPETHQGHETWAKLSPATFLTPYTEIREILTRLNLAPGELIIDLGAGYGRMAFVIARHFPKIRFTGYELVEARVLESLRCLMLLKSTDPTQFACIQLIQADLSDPHFDLPRARAYFIYDFGTRQAIEGVLEKIRKSAFTDPVIVVGRGRASRDAIERHHPWLSQVKEPRHFSHYSVYRSS